MSQTWRNHESEVTAEEGGDPNGRLVAKVRVGSEWVVVTVPSKGDEDKGAEGEGKEGREDSETPPEVAGD